MMFRRSCLLPPRRRLWSAFRENHEAHRANRSWSCHCDRYRSARTCPAAGLGVSDYRVQARQDVWSGRHWRRTAPLRSSAVLWPVEAPSCLRLPGEAVIFERAFDMAAELAAHGGKKFLAKTVLHAAAETGEQGRGNHVR